MSQPIEICKASFINSAETSVEDLFDGYDSLKAITFSSGTDFMARVIDKYNYAEVVFGNSAIMPQSLSAVMAFQQKTLEKLALPKNVKAFSGRIAEGTLRFYVSRDMRSHEKLYLLEAADKHRVIVGSANFSASAFCGRQRENILVFDDDGAWRYYSLRYATYRDECSDSISQTLIGRVADKTEYLDDNVAELPIAKTIETEKLVVVSEENVSELDEEMVFIADVRGHEDTLKPFVPRPRKTNGACLIKPKHIETLIEKVKTERTAIKARRNIMPVLHLDMDARRLSFNGNNLSLRPDDDAVAHDARNLITYLESIKDVFHGNVRQTQANYWRFANWYFSSIFAPRLRWEASANNYDVTNFPVFGIMYGDSNGGKSTYTHLLAKLMCGAKVEFSSSKQFTTRDLDTLRVNCEGLPIHIDDLARSQYQSHREKVIKDDTWGLYEHNVNYPAIAISTNSVPSLSADISKRMVVCHIGTRIDREAGLRNAKAVNDTIATSTSALFCAYVGKMIPKVETMIDSMRSSDADYFPDIFALSSETLISILEEHIDKLPEYITELDFDDYFGDSTISQNAIAKIRNAWLSEPKSFKVLEAENRLVYSYPDGANIYELNYIKDELPVQLDAKVASRTLSMNLSAARKLFGIAFKQPWYARLIR